MRGFTVYANSLTSAKMTCGSAIPLTLVSNRCNDDAEETPVRVKE